MNVEHGKPAVILAPMEGVTDAPMRALLTEVGGFSHCVSEFIRISQEILPDKVYRRYVPELDSDGCTPSGVPVQVQLLGGDEEKLAVSAQQAVRLGARGIDINFGCPAPTVNRHDGGATLLKYPERIEKIVSRVREYVPKYIPVSAKLRLGWDKMDAIFENAKRAENGGASWITVHARTKLQGYSPPAHWHYLKEVRHIVKIPVIVNGDIYTKETFDECLRVTGSEHYMLGRGSLADPTLGYYILKRLGVNVESPPSIDWIKTLRKFSELAGPHGDGPNYTLRRLKQWMNIASKRGSRLSLDTVKRASSKEEFFEKLSMSLADPIFEVSGIRSSTAQQ